MARTARVFTPTEIAFVRKAYEDNSHTIRDICEELGISTGHFKEATYKNKAFGVLPRRQGRGRKKRPEDTKDMIMGITRDEFERRRDNVRESWSDHERCHRIMWCPRPGTDARWDSGGIENRGDPNNPIKQAPKPPNPNPWFDS